MSGPCGTIRTWQRGILKALCFSYSTTFRHTWLSCSSLPCGSDSPQVHTTSWHVLRPPKSRGSSGLCAPSSCVLTFLQGSGRYYHRLPALPEVKPSLPLRDWKLRPPGLCGLEQVASPLCSPFSPAPERSHGYNLPQGIRMGMQWVCLQCAESPEGGGSHLWNIQAHPLLLHL